MLPEVREDAPLGRGGQGLGCAGQDVALVRREWEPRAHCGVRRRCGQETGATGQPLLSPPTPHAGPASTSFVAFQTEEPRFLWWGTESHEFYTGDLSC